jgi:hypothetical protein
VTSRTGVRAGPPPRGKGPADLGLVGRQLVGYRHVRHRVPPDGERHRIHAQLRSISRCPGCVPRWARGGPRRVGRGLAEQPRHHPGTPAEAAQHYEQHDPAEDAAANTRRRGGGDSTCARTGPPSSPKSTGCYAPAERCSSPTSPTATPSPPAQCATSTSGPVESQAGCPVRAGRPCLNRPASTTYKSDRPTTPSVMPAAKRTRARSPCSVTPSSQGRDRKQAASGCAYFGG